MVKSHSSVLLIKTEDATKCDDKSKVLVHPLLQQQKLMDILPNLSTDITLLLSSKWMPAGWAHSKCLATTKESSKKQDSTKQLSNSSWIQCAPLLTISLSLLDHYATNSHHEYPFFHLKIMPYALSPNCCRVQELPLRSRPVCSGCRSSFSKHSEHRNYTSSQGHPSSQFGNAYYHIKKVPRTGPLGDSKEAPLRIWCLK